MLEDSREKLGDFPFRRALQKAAVIYVTQNAFSALQLIIYSSSYQSDYYDMLFWSALWMPMLMVIACIKEQKYSIEVSLK